MSQTNMTESLQSTLQQMRGHSRSPTILCIHLVTRTVDREIFSGRNFHLLNFRVINFLQSSKRRKLNATKLETVRFFLHELQVAYTKRNPYTYVHGSHRCVKRKWRAFERSRVLGGIICTENFGNRGHWRGPSVSAGAWECNRRLCCTNGGAVHVLRVRTTLTAFSQYLLHLFVRFRDCLRSETATL